MVKIIIEIDKKKLIGCFNERTDNLEKTLMEIDNLQKLDFDNLNRLNSELPDSFYLSQAISFVPRPESLPYEISKWPIIYHNSANHPYGEHIVGFAKVKE